MQPLENSFQLLSWILKNVPLIKSNMDRDCCFAIDYCFFKINDVLRFLHSTKVHFSNILCGENVFFIVSITISMPDKFFEATQWAIYNKFI